MRPLALLLPCLLALALPRATQAVSIALDPPSQAVDRGDTFTLTLPASALAGAAIGAFDVDVSFDAAHVAFVGAAFSNALGDLALGDALPDVVPGAGTLNLASVSLLDPITLAALQGDPVALVTLTFQATAAGAAAFGLDSALLSDAFAVALVLESKTGATVDVPEPGAALLVLGPLLALATGAALRRGRA